MPVEFQQAGFHFYDTRLRKPSVWTALPGGACKWRVSPLVFVSIPPVNMLPLSLSEQWHAVSLHCRGTICWL